MQKLINALVVNGIISEEDKEAYLFGLECLLLKSLYMASFFAVSLWMGKVGEFILFSFIYFFLRGSAGGFHAETRLSCYIFSLIQVVATLAVTDWLANLRQPQFTPAFGSLIILGFAAQAIILLLAPVDNPNKVLDEVEICHYRKQTRWKVFILDLFLALSFIFQLRVISALVFLCFIEIAGLLLLQWSKNKKLEFDKTVRH